MFHWIIKRKNSKSTSTTIEWYYGNRYEDTDRWTYVAGIATPFMSEQAAVNMAVRMDARYTYIVVKVSI